jgi:hypothetical protein
VRVVKSLPVAVAAILFGTLGVAGCASASTEDGGFDITEVHHRLSNGHTVTCLINQMTGYSMDCDWGNAK